jgi:EAL domain-containing protein (putative c-di-GMP-specific phosphodiesterase class I)
VNQLGRFVIDEVTSFLSLKQKEGKTLKVSINASYKELLQNDYVSYLINRVEEKGLKRSQINIEITESTISEYLDVVSESLTALREHAFEIQMDDFGTGYSSLYQLGRLPIQVLKIDKIFILGLETDEKMFALTKLIIDIAHRLEIKIIAEGVETINQYQILKNMGCDYYQGYLFSKPKTADEVDAFSIRNSLGS